MPPIDEGANSPSAVKDKNDMESAAALPRRTAAGGNRASA